MTKLSRRRALALFAAAPAAAALVWTDVEARQAHEACVAESKKSYEQVAKPVANIVG